MSDLKAIADIIKKMEKFLIASHINPDGDAIGSQLAMAKFLENTGKKVTILNHSSVPEIYQFLPGSEKIRTTIPDSENFDVALILDSSDEDRLGEIVKTVIAKIPIVINIDHHISNNKFGKLCYIDQKAAATAIIIYELIKISNGNIDADIAKSIYTAILTDTGSFHYSNTNPQTHQVVADLIKFGADPNKIYEQIYEIFNLPTIKLLGMALLSLEMNSNGKIAWMKLEQKDFASSGTTNRETEGFINYIQMIKGVKVAIFFREIQDKNNGIIVKVSFRSKEGIDVNKIASVFGGGGHPQAAGCIVTGDMNTVAGKVVDEVEKHI